MPGRVESWTTMRATPSEEARMRGEGTGSEPHMWSYVPLERRIPSDHPLRPLRAMVDTILGELSPQFDELHSKVGRPSIPPEHLLRALLLQVLYTVRSERCSWTRLQPALPMVRGFFHYRSGGALYRKGHRGERSS